jgi:hypothetical protein
MGTGGHVPLRAANVVCVDLDPLAFILHFASQLCIASKLKAFEWKHSRIYMLEVETLPQSCMP